MVNELAEIGRKSAVGRSAALGATEIDMGYVPLTAEGLMAYCAMKLRDLDKQVQTAFASQKERNHLGKALADLTEALNLKSNGIPKDTELHKAGQVDIEAAYDKAILEVGGIGTDLGSKLAAEKEKFTKTATGQGPSTSKQDEADVSPSEMAKFAESVGSMQSTLNRDGEMQMIQLQSIMSQRQQALQMCTNMIQGVNQSAMGIVQNVGK